MTTDIERDFGALAEKLRRSTVCVRAGHRSSGSGVVWTADGTIVTNAHVATQRYVGVTLADGRELRGQVDRRDERVDLASIAVDADDLTPVDVRDPHDIRVGELVVAFGHPLGVSNVLTTGIAYAAHGPDSRFVRADLQLAPGNSGGPLADAHGRVIGINSMYADGLALAVPSDVVQRFLSVLPMQPRLGVMLMPARTHDGASVYVVTGIERGSTAERSGILPGDVVSRDGPATFGTAESIDVIRAGMHVRIPLVRQPQENSAAA
jgi:serine protease Do